MMRPWLSFLNAGLMYVGIMEKINDFDQKARIWIKIAITAIDSCLIVTMIVLASHFAALLLIAKLSIATWKY